MTNLNKQIDKFYSMVLQSPGLASTFLFNSEPPMFSGCSAKAWPEVRDAARERLFSEAIKGTVSRRVIPLADVQFLGYTETDEKRKMHFWSFAYYHGMLQDMYDAKGVGPGDLVQCSVDLYKFPLGVTRVEVNGKDAIVYLWEEKSAGRLDDGQGNQYMRHLRHGLIVAEEDTVERHEYAYRKLKEQSVCL